MELEDSTRHLALEFLLTVAEQTPTVARKLPGFCASVVPVALQMMLDVEGDTPEELQARYLVIARRGRHARGARPSPVRVRVSLGSCRRAAASRPQTH